MHDLSGFQRDLLVDTYGLEDPKGLEIKEALDEYYLQDVNHGRFYPNLDDLVEKGLLEKGAKDDRTNEYVVTAAGADAVADRWEWEDAYVEGLE